MYSIALRMRRVHYNLLQLRRNHNTKFQWNRLINFCSNPAQRTTDTTNKWHTKRPPKLHLGGGKKTAAVMVTPTTTREFQSGELSEHSQRNTGVSQRAATACDNTQQATPACLVHVRCDRKTTASTEPRCIRRSQSSRYTTLHSLLHVEPGGVRLWDGQKMDIVITWHDAPCDRWRRPSSSATSQQPMNDVHATARRYPFHHPTPPLKLPPSQEYGLVPVFRFSLGRAIYIQLYSPNGSNIKTTNNLTKHNK